MSGAAPPYREIPPRRELRPFVECFWTLGPEPGAAAGERRILPDGCIDILFEEGEARVVGPMTRALVLPPRPPAGPAAAIAAVRFRPGGAAPLLGIAAHELTDRHAPLADLWHGAGDLAARVEGHSGATGRLAVIEDKLMRRAARAGAPDPRVRAAVEEIAASRGALAIGALAGRLEVTRQHLARLFEANVGHGPKLLARVVRVRALIAAVERAAPAPRRDWAAAALAAGYCDQAHMIAEFRALAGVTPGAWFNVPNLQYEAAAAG